MKRVAIAALVMLVLGMSALPVAAQEQLFGQSMGWIYVSGSNTTYQPNLTVTAFVPFPVFIMAVLDYGDIGRAELNPGTGMGGYEAALILPADLTVVSATIRNFSVNLGTDRNLIVGLAPPITAIQTPIDLVEYSMLALSATNLPDAPLDFGATNPSSFSPAVPGFVDNQDVGECTKADGGAIKCLRPFAKTTSGVLNCVSNCITPVERDSWSSLKGTFSN